jgi:glycosyltransferase involved in cell wall biosynthesis
MRLLFVNNSADIYGASRCMERVCRRLLGNGHDITVVLPEDGPLANVLRECGARVLLHKHLAIIDRQAFRSFCGIARLIVRWPLSALQIAFWVWRFHIDAVHTNTAMMPSPALAALLTRRPHLWHVREFFGEFGPCWKIYQVYLCLLSTRVIAISGAVERQFAPRFLPRVKVIYDGLEAEFRNIGPASSDDQIRSRFGLIEPRLIGVVGRIKWVRKGQEVLVRAFGRLKDHHPDVRLLIIGSTAKGNEQHLVKLKELSRTVGVAERITFTGDLDVTGAVYASLDVTVVPSIQPEPFGCVVMESMAAGTVVIGSNCGGIAEQIVDGISGLLFPPGDDARLAQQLDRVLADDSYRRRLADGGRRRFQQAFLIEDTVLQLTQAFEQAIAGS